MLTQMSYHQRVVDREHPERSSTWEGEKSERSVLRSYLQPVGLDHRGRLYRCRRDSL